MGHIFFPLTPALSPGERENSPLSSGHARDGVCQSSVRKTRARSPCPVGGQGKRRFDRHRLSHIQGIDGVINEPNRYQDSTTPILPITFTASLYLELDGCCDMITLKKETRAGP